MISEQMTEKLSKGLKDKGKLFSVFQVSMTVHKLCLNPKPDLWPVKRASSICFRNEEPEGKHLVLKKPIHAPTFHDVKMRDSCLRAHLRSFELLQEWTSDILIYGSLCKKTITP